MSTLSMAPPAREAFLAETRVGVLAVARDGQAPSLTPVWYRYAGGVVEIVTSSGTRKVDLLRTAGRAGLCVQREPYPPAYVTVEGDVSVGDVPDGLVETIASRYLGPEGGAAYAAQAHDDIVIRMVVDTWRTADFSRLEQG